MKARWHVKVVVVVVILSLQYSRFAFAQLGEEALTGSWTVDFAKSAEVTKDERSSQALEFSAKSGVKLDWQFKADGTLTMKLTAANGKTNVKEGKWKVLKTEGSVIDVEIIQLTNNGDEKTDKLKITVVQTGLITNTEEGSKVVLALRRVKDTE